MVLWCRAAHKESRKTFFVSVVMKINSPPNDSVLFIISVFHENVMAKSKMFKDKIEHMFYNVI
ncbi:hypothetical protein LNA01_14860 [Companilactobacillus nantensis]|nr:hypothetical protein LNA01_14860 [Companilactobacillus nantensis]